MSCCVEVTARCRTLSLFHSSVNQGFHMFACSGGKARVQQLVQKGQLFYFGQTSYTGGHKPIEHARYGLRHGECFPYPRAMSVMSLYAVACQSAREPRAIKTHTHVLMAIGKLACVHTSSQECCHAYLFTRMLACMHVLRRWYSSSKPYYVEWSRGFEPWVITARARMPLYDGRYRGYGGNKQQHVQHLDALKYK